MNTQTICIFGGTGFVGSHLANALAKAGWRVRIPSRRRERHRDVLVIPTVDVVEANIHDEKELDALLSGCDAAINLVAILNARRRGEFQRVHVELPRRIIQACLNAGVRRLLHMSALNADAQRGTSEYLRSKGLGEQVAIDSHCANLAVTVFRPSIIFGPGDHFFNRFAGLLRTAPVALPLACPKSRFAPVYVGDVAAAFLGALRDYHSGGQRYDLCGPRQYTLEELVGYANQVLGTGRQIIGLSDPLSALMARLLGALPGKLMTYDNYLSLKTDAVCPQGAPSSFECQTPIEAVVPYYLGRKDQRSLYDAYRTARHEPL